MTQLLFSILSIAYIAAIFLLADSPVVSDIAPFNPYSLLHIPLYGILTFLLIFSLPQRKKFVSITNPTNPTNSTSPIDPKNSTNSMSPTNSINPINPRNPRNLLVAGLIALVVAIADEFHQAYIPSRDASVTDVFLDVIGIGLCLFLIHRIEHVSGFSKIAGFLRRIT
jgi:hypothetical protein